jgi:hypothetical protein
VLLRLPPFNPNFNSTSASIHYPLEQHTIYPSPRHFVVFLLRHVKNPHHAAIPPLNSQYQDHQQWLQIAGSRYPYEASGYNAHKPDTHYQMDTGKSRQGEPVRALHKTAINFRLSVTVTPQSPALPGKRSFIRPIGRLSEQYVS